MTNGNKWCLGVASTVVAGIIYLLISAGIGFQLTHYARSGETEDRSFENEQRNAEQDRALAPILEIVEKLGQRAAAEDAAYEERAKLCRQGVIKDPVICGAVDEDVVE